MEERKMLNASIEKYFTGVYTMANLEKIKNLGVYKKSASNASQTKAKIFEVEAQM